MDSDSALEMCRTAYRGSDCLCTAGDKTHLSINLLLSGPGSIVSDSECDAWKNKRRRRSNHVSRLPGLDCCILVTCTSALDLGDAYIHARAFCPAHTLLVSLPADRLTATPLVHGGIPQYHHIRMELFFRRATAKACCLSLSSTYLLLLPRNSQKTSIMPRCG